MSFNSDLKKILKKYKKNIALVDIHSKKELTYEQLFVKLQKIKFFIKSNKVDNLI